MRPISPNKTIEGSLGGIAAAIVIALVFHWLFIREVPAGLVIIFSVVAAVVGPLTGELSFEFEGRRGLEQVWSNLGEGDYEILVRDVQLSGFRCNGVGRQRDVSYPAEACPVTRRGPCRLCRWRRSPTKIRRVFEQTPWVLIC